MDIFNLLKFITDTFNRVQIPYMLGGSMAMNCYTVSRASQDIDIVVQLFEKDVDILIKHLDNFYYNRITISEEILRGGMFNIIDLTTGFKVDLILLKNSNYDKQAFERRNLNADFGFDIHVTSLEDLIIAKIRWIQQLYSDRQANDIRMLILNNESDLEYIKKWCAELKLNTYNLI